ncbi:MAG: aminoacyltransferase [Lactobacillales bacterium]|nr:aminoacyltransferase [Lactobacillales bacterium]
MYHFEIGIKPSEHDAFIASHPLANLLQSSGWAKVKGNWGSEIVGVYHDDSLVASAQLLIRKLPLGMTMIYISRGPLMDYSNEPLVKIMLKGLRFFGASQRALFVKMDPTIKYRAFQPGEEATILGDAPKTIHRLQRAGLKWQGLTGKMVDTVQPRFQANVYRENFGEDKLSKKTRQMLRTARKKEIEIQKGGMEFIPQFAEIMKKTEKRQGIALRNADYYKKLLQTYPDSSFIMLAKLNLRKLHGDTTQRYKEEEREFQKLKENQVKKKHQLKEVRDSLIRELSELNEKIKKSGEEVIIAGTLTIVFARTSEILYAGMDEDYKRYMPAYLTWFDSIQEAFAMGVQTCNLGGLESNLNNGLLQFKRHFNPTIEEFIGEFDLPVNRFLFTLSQCVYKLKKYRKKKV